MEHLDLWIDAYLDGETSTHQKAQIEKHLEICQTCREVLADRRSLTAILQELPPASNLKPDELFISEISLRTKQAPSFPHHDSPLQWGWRLVPVCLLLAWAFLISLSFTTNLLRLLPGGATALQGYFSSLPTAPELNLLAGNYVFELGLGALRWLRPGSFLGFNLATMLLAFAIIGILYLAWLASWWTQAQKVQSSNG